MNLLKFAAAAMLSAALSPLAPLEGALDSIGDAARPRRKHFDGKYTRKARDKRPPEVRYAKRRGQDE